MCVGTYAHRCQRGVYKALSGHGGATGKEGGERVGQRFNETPARWHIQISGAGWGSLAVHRFYDVAASASGMAGCAIHVHVRHVSRRAPLDCLDRDLCCGVGAAHGRSGLSAL